MKLKLFIKQNIAYGFMLMILVGMAPLSAATIDIMTLYTNESSPTQVYQLIAEANRIYKNNDIDVVLNDVGSYRVNAAIEPTAEWLRLVKDAKSVQSLRDRIKADMVAVISDTSELYCGIGYLGYGNQAVTNDEYMYSISAGTCGANTFVHELGHNMGLAHSERQGDVGSVFAYGRGFGVDDSFATIMAYPSAFGTAQRVSIFSNPYRSDCNNLRCSNWRAFSQKAIKNVVPSLVEMR